MSYRKFTDEDNQQNTIWFFYIPLSEVIGLRIKSQAYPESEEIAREYSFEVILRTGKAFCITGVLDDVDFEFWTMLYTVKIIEG